MLNITSNPNTIQDILSINTRRAKYLSRITLVLFLLLVVPVFLFAVGVTLIFAIAIFKGYITADNLLTVGLWPVALLVLAGVWTHFINETLSWVERFVTRRIAPSFVIDTSRPNVLLLHGSIYLNNKDRAVEKLLRTRPGYVLSEEEGIERQYKCSLVAVPSSSPYAGDIAAFQSGKKISFKRIQQIARSELAS